MPDSTGAKLYQSLSKEKSQIRILELQPESFSAPICVTLETVCFVDAGTVSYEALSYTWGTSEDSQTILVKVGDTSWPTTVTRNLYEALLYLRHERDPRILWVDAICINQADVEERSQQVALMGSIFSGATKVIAWIGPHRDDSPKAMRCFEMVASNVVVRWETKEISSDRVDWETRALLDEAELLAINQLLRRSYFERMWVWQEVRLSGSRCALRCGDDEIPWRDFCTTVRFLCRAPFPPLEDGLETSLRGHVNGLDRLCDPRAAAFLDMVEVFRSRKCADPRDRLYSSQLLLRLANHNFVGGIVGEFSISGANIDPQLEPDYSRPVDEVFIDAAIKISRNGTHLPFLVHAGATEEPLDHLQTQMNLPSWVPDWRHPSRATRMTGTRAAAGSTNRASVTPDRALTAEGLLIDTVQRVYAFANFAFPHGFPAALLYLHRAISSDGYRVGISLSTLCQVLCMGEFAETHVPTRTDLPAYDLSLKFVTSVFEREELPAVQEFDIVIRHMTQYCRGRALYISESSAIGLGPEHLRPGDRIAVLLGCPVAASLRPLNHSHFQFVGPGYHAGIMIGEALLGPLPVRYEAVFHRHLGTGKLHWAYLDRERNLVQYEDPRLPPLPSEWRKMTDEAEDELPIYRNETGQLSSYSADPRCTAEELMRRGVQIQRITLI